MIHPQAIIEPGAVIGENVTIGPWTYIASNVVIGDNYWTVYTSDGKNSAQWEHTIVVTKTGCEVLTLRKEETLNRHLHN